MQWAQAGATARVFAICRQFFRGFNLHQIRWICSGWIGGGGFSPEKELENRVAIVLGQSPPLPSIWIA